MTDWTLKVAASEPLAVVSSDTKFYYLEDTTEDIYEYDPATNTRTLIIDKSVAVGIATGDDIASIAWFNSDLYIGLSDRGGGAFVDVKVSKWTGAVNGLTDAEVFSAGASDFAADSHFPPRLFTTADNIIAVSRFSEGGAPGTGESHHSADGSSWSTSATGWDTIPDTDIRVAALNEKNTQSPSGQIFGRFQELVTGDMMIYQYSENAHTWRQVKDLFALTYLHSAPPAATKHWTGTAWTSDWTATTDPSAGAIHPLYQVDMPYSIGIDVATGDKIYRWNGTSWQLEDTMATIRLQGDISVGIRMDDREAFILGFGIGGPGWNIYQRDAPLLDYNVTHNQSGMPGNII